MATIKSTLALEDKMTPALSKAEKQAIANIKEYNKLAKEVDNLQKSMGDLHAAGEGNSALFRQFASVSDSLVNKMKQIENGTLNVAEGNKQANHSFTELNQGLELAQKGYSLLHSAMNKANEMVEYSKNQFNAEYTAASKMHNMMGATKDEINSMYDYAASLQNIGVIGDEAIISGMGVLSTSASSTESLKELAKATANATVGLHGLNSNQSAYESTANYMQKALEGNAEQLYRNQILTKKQADYINKLNTTQEKEAALTKMVTDNFGEANQVLAQTAQGGMMQADNKLNDMKETLGDKLMPIISAFKEFLVDVLSPAIDFISENIGIFIGALGVLAGALIAASIAQAILNAVMYANPIGLIIALIAIWIIVLIALWEKCEGFRDAVVGQWVSMMKGLGRLYNLTIDVYNGIMGMVTSLNQTANAAFKGMINAFANTAISMIESGNGIIGIFKKIVDLYNQIAGALGGKTINIDAALTTEGINKIRSTALGAVDSILPTTYEKKDKIQIDKMDEWLDKGGEKLKDFTLSKYINDKMSSVTDVINDNVNNIDSNLGDVINPSAGGGAGKALQTTTNDSLLSDEDMQLLLDIATRDYKLTYQQVTPNITLTFGDIRETADVDDILDQVADRLEEIYDSNLEVANG